MIIGTLVDCITYCILGYLHYFNWILECLQDHAHLTYYCYNLPFDSQQRWYQVTMRAQGHTNRKALIYHTNVILWTETLVSLLPVQCLLYYTTATGVFNNIFIENTVAIIMQQYPDTKKVNYHIHFGTWQYSACTMHQSHVTRCLSHDTH